MSLIGAEFVVIAVEKELSQELVIIKAVKLIKIAE
jgi:20S proteasome alpha/beta subunit